MLIKMEIMVFGLFPKQWPGSLFLLEPLFQSLSESLSDVDPLADSLSNHFTGLLDGLFRLSLLLFLFCHFCHFYSMVIHYLLCL